MTFAFDDLASPLGERRLCIYILFTSNVILRHKLDVILMYNILDVLLPMHVLDFLPLLLATTVIAPMFGEFQPQSNNAAGSVVSKTLVLSLTMVLKHKYAPSDPSGKPGELSGRNTPGGIPTGEPTGPRGAPGPRTGPCRGP